MSEKRGFDEVNREVILKKQKSIEKCSIVYYGIIKQIDDNTEISIKNMRQLEIYKHEFNILYLLLLYTSCKKQELCMYSYSLFEQFLIIGENPNIYKGDNDCNLLMTIIVSINDQQLIIKYMELLIRHGLDLNYHTPICCTVLVLLIKLKKTDIIIYLLSNYEVNPNIICNELPTINYAIAYNLDIKIIHLLLQKGANPNGIDNNESPLIRATYTNNRNIIVLLLFHGARIDINYNGISIIAWALEMGKNQIFEIYVKFGLVILSNLNIEQQLSARGMYCLSIVNRFVSKIKESSHDTIDNILTGKIVNFISLLQFLTIEDLILLKNKVNSIHEDMKNAFYILSAGESEKSCVRLVEEPGPISVLILEHLVPCETIRKNIYKLINIFKYIGDFNETTPLIDIHKNIGRFNYEKTIENLKKYLEII